MRRLLLVFFIGFISMVAHGQNTRYDTIRYARKYYAKRVALFHQEPVKPGRTIFIGNSIVEFGDWKNLLKDTTVVNRGIAADNTFGVLDRLDDIIIRQPDKLFIEIGINDVSQNIPFGIIVKNIITIVKQVKAKSAHTKIYVHSILPTNDNVKNEYPEAFHKNGISGTVNDLLMRKAAKNSFTYVELNRELRDKNGKLNVKYAKPDGIHLNEAGYQIWINLLKSKKFL